MRRQSYTTVDNAACIEELSQRGENYDGFVFEQNTNLKQMQ